MSLFPLWARFKRLIDSNDFAWMLPLPPWAEARDRQVRQIRTAARTVIRRQLVRERGWVHLLASSLAWPLIATIKSLIAFGRMHADQRKMNRLLDLIWLQLAHNFRISDQEYFRLERTVQRSQVRRFITDGENKAFLEYINRGTRPERVRDKIPFAKFCAQHRLPTIPLIAECEGSGAPANWFSTGPEGDLFLKPASLWSGQGAGIFACNPDARGTWRADDGTVLNLDTIARYIDRRLDGIAWILQPRLSSRSAWRELSPDALATVRVVTGRESPTSPVEIIGGFMRFPRKNAVVDNLFAGGLGADFDPATGRLGHARALGPDSAWHAHHPDTGAKIAGQIIPGWENVAALAVRAHHAIPEIALIGWDIALPDAEPILVEANTNWGVLLDTPLGNTRYVEILNNGERNPS